MTPETAQQMDRDTMWFCVRVRQRRAQTHRRALRRLILRYEEALREERELAAVFEAEYHELLHTVAESGAHPYVAKLWERRRPRQLVFDFGEGA